MSDLEVIKEIEKLVSKTTGENIELQKLDTIEHTHHRGYLYDNEYGAYGICLYKCNLNNLNKLCKLLSKLPNLKLLILVDNGINDIKPLEKLTRLVNLNLAMNHIEDISPLIKLIELDSLNLVLNEIKDITVLSALQKLLWLNLLSNKIQSLESLSKLFNLEFLNLSGNNISDITPIKDLKQLKALELSNNPINNLPEWIADYPEMNIWEADDLREGYITFWDNPLISPPMDIIRQGKLAVKKYFEYQNASIYFHDISVKNYKCFGNEQSLNLFDENNQPAMWTVIMGDNGTGKTTLLKLLGLMSPKMNDGFYDDNTFNTYYSFYPVINDLIVNKKESIFVKCEHFFVRKQNQPFTLFNGYQYSDYGYGSPTILHYIDNPALYNFFICTYGANRIMSDGKLEQIDALNIETHLGSSSLYSENSKLINAHEWILQLDYTVKSTEGKEKEWAENQLNKIKDLLINVLPDVTDIRTKPITLNNQKPAIEFLVHTAWVSMRDLSLGYQTLAAWMVDLAARMFYRYPHSKNPLAEPAIVLVDEIDLHLHPKWQRKIVHHLTHIFTHTQFIVTAHSPLIVQSAKNANIVLLKWKGNHVEIINRKQSEIQQWRLEQILTSDFFDIDNSYSYEYQLLEEDKRRILSKSELSEEDDKRLQEIGKRFEEITVSPNSDADNKALEIIRKAAEILKK